MATIFFTGKAVAIVQVTTVDVGAYDAAGVYSLTVNGVSVTTTAAGDAEATATALVAAWNASTHPYFTIATASVGTGSPSNTIVLTGDEAGFPFTVTASATGSGTMGAVSNSTEASGPHHWSTASNWSSGAIPQDDDIVIIDKQGVRICWDLDRTGTSPNSILSRLTIRGDVRIGLASANVAITANGETVSALAPEYREDYLKIGIATTEILANLSTATPSGSGRIKIDNQSTAAATCTVAATASASADTNLPSIRLLANSANWDLYVERARSGVGIAVGPGETATVGEIYLVDPSGVSKLILGEGVTHTLVTQNGGTLELNSAATLPAVTVNAGNTLLLGTQTITLLTTNGGNVIHNNSGSVTTVTQNKGSIDWTHLERARTVTTYNFYGGERKINHSLITITNDNRTGRKIERIEAL